MIEFEQYGEGAHKLIGLHGWFGDENTFKTLENSLDPERFQCLWLAHRGYGKSKEIRGSYTMEEMADDALDVVRSLGWDKFSVIGHSMGGKAAQLLSAKAGGAVDKLVTVTPAPAVAIPFDEQTLGLFNAATYDPGSRAMVINFSTGGKLSPIWVDRLVKDSIARSTTEASAGYLHSWAGQDLSSMVRSFDAPTLVLVGANDPSITTESCRLDYGGKYSNLKIVALENSGHYPMEEIPLTFGATVETFLGV